jgi:PAS domain S-box-containing protein
MSTTGDGASATPSLGAHLRANRDAILREWAQKVRILRSARPLPVEQLLDHLPELIESLACATEAGHEAGHEATRTAVHVIERLRSSFELEELIMELSLLREAAMSSWRSARPAGDPEQERALHHAFDRAMVAAADRYGEVHGRILHALDRMSTVALVSDDLDAILGALVTTFRDESPTAEVVSILLVDEVGALHARATASGSLDDAALTTRGEQLAARVAVTQTPQYGHPRLDDDAAKYLLYGVPLLDRTTTLGVALLAAPARSRLSERDRVLFASMVARASAAIRQHALRETTARQARQLAEAEARYRATFEHAGVGIAELALDGRWVRLNERYCKLLGYSHDELLTRRWQDVTHADDVEVDRVLSRRLAAGELDSYEVDKRCVRKDGRVVSVRLTMGVIRDTDGRPVHFVAAAQDIDMAKRMRQRLEIMAGASARLVSTLDPQEAIERVAQLAVPALSDWCGVMVERAPGASELELRAVAHRDPACVEHVWEMQRRRPYRALDGLLEQVRREGAPKLLTEVDERALRRLACDEEHLAMLRELGVRSLLIIPLRARERTFGALLLAHAESNRRFDADDVDLLQVLAERGAMAIDNAQLHDETRRAVQLRDQILAIVSHDLRNPLSAIDLASQLLYESATGAGDARASRQASIIRRNAARMARLIGDLLDVSSIQAGKLAIVRRPVELGPLMAEAREAHEPHARDKGIDFDVRAEVDGARLSGDRDRILQVLSNLVGNAIKFCRAGDRVTVQARVVDGQARIQVSDTGPGIPEQDRGHVFDLYWKGRRGGTGLGLAISKGIVEAHGGRIEVAGGPERGSTFAFTVPLVQHEQAA